MSVPEITSFPEKSLENVGGLASFLFSLIDHVLYIPPYAGVELNSAVVFAPGKEWYTGRHTPRKFGFNENLVTRDAGKYFFTDIKGFYPKLSEESLSLFFKMSQCQFIVCCKDNNGLYRVCGTPDYPLDFSFNQDTGNRVSDYNGYEFRFSGYQKKPSPYYDPSLL